jgi:hypothetical protein
VPGRVWSWAHIRDHAAAGHGVQDPVSGAGEVIQGVGHQLGRDPAGPVAAEPVVAVVELLLIPGAQAPVQGLEFVPVMKASQAQRPGQGQVHVVVGGNIGIISVISGSSSRGQASLIVVIGGLGIGCLD